VARCQCLVKPNKGGKSFIDGAPGFSSGFLYGSAPCHYQIMWVGTDVIELLSANVDSLSNNVGLEAWTLSVNTVPRRPMLSGLWDYIIGLLHLPLAARVRARVIRDATDGAWCLCRRGVLGMADRERDVIV
jgi:hypothetical protein